MATTDEGDYLPTQGFFHAVLRNVGLCITISLAAMTLNRYWRSEGVFVTVATWFVALMALLLSTYINGVLLSDEAIVRPGMGRWRPILYVVLVCQAVLLVSYGFIGKVVFSEAVADRAVVRPRRAAQRRTKRI